MADENEAAGIEVRKSPYYDMATAAIRQGVLVVGAVGGLASFVSAHDWVGLVAYVQTAPFVGALATVMAVGAFGWGQWKTRHRAVQLSQAAQDPRVPDESVKLKG